jgi:hypothetical protein
MDIQDKDDLLDKLSVCYDNARYLMTLAEENHSEPETVDRIAQNAKWLKDVIDGLLGDAYGNWREAARQLTAALMKNNVIIKASIENIERAIEITQSIVSATNSLDDVITVAKTLLSK